MLKRILLCFVVLLLFASQAFAENWTYLGRYAVKNNPVYVNTTDALILNHLFPCTSQPANNYQQYDVYYFHDHKDDVRTVNDFVNLISVPIKAKIVPLNIYGKPMFSDGVFCGQIYSDVKITNAGVFEVRPIAFSIRDSVSGKTIFRAEGEMEGQVLVADSAAQRIVAATGPHKDWKTTIGGMPLSMLMKQN
ncbi:MAG: hypothetical protein IJQ30_06955 [Acidaminococcaceae bacterium]|nr:hypothetical protein [Acidaminococcaceae bacterium]